MIRDGHRYVPTGLVDYEPGTRGRPTPVGDPIGTRTPVGLCSACLVHETGSARRSHGVSQCGDPSWRVAVMAEPLGYRTQYRMVADYDGNDPWSGTAGLPRMAVETMDDGPVLENVLSRGGKVQLVALNTGLDNEGFLLGHSSWTGWEGVHTHEALRIARGYAPDLAIPSLEEPFERVAIGSRKVTDALLLSPIEVPLGMNLHPARVEARAAWLSAAYLIREAAWRVLEASPDGLIRVIDPSRHLSDCRRDLPD